MTALAGLDEVAWFMSYITLSPVYPARCSDESSERRTKLALAILRDPAALPEPLSELELAGLWWLVSQSIAQRPAVCATAINGGLFEIGMAALRTDSPIDWYVTPPLLTPPPAQLCSAPLRSPLLTSTIDGLPHL